MRTDGTSRRGSGERIARAWAAAWAARVWLVSLVVGARAAAFRAHRVDGVARAARGDRARVRHLAATALGLFVVSLLPGARWIREGAGDPRLETIAAPALPAAVTDRDVTLEVHAVRGDRSPVPHALVTVLAILDDVAHVAAKKRAARDGVAVIEELPRASAWILVEAEGYARGSTHVILATGERRRLDVVLGPAQALDLEVKDERGDPVAGAALEVHGRDPMPVGARTNAAGVAHALGLGPGPFTVTARAEGFEETTRNGLAAGATGKITLVRAATLVVHVRAPGGAPADGAAVLVTGTSMWPPQKTVTDAEGTTTIVSLSTGRYSLRASLGNDVSPTELDVELVGGDRKDVNLRLAPGTMVTCAASDSVNGAAIAGARITIAEGGLSPFPIEGTTGSDGRARLGPIARGPAAVAARADGYVARGGIPVDPESPEVPVRLQRAGTLTGRVKDARGYPVDGAELRVVGIGEDGMPTDDEPSLRGFGDALFAAGLQGPRPLVPAGELGVMPGPVPSIPHGGLPGGMPVGIRGPSPVALEPWVTRSDGTFRLRPITPGRVRVVVHHPQYVDAESEPVRLSPGGEANVDVVLFVGGAIEGRVEDSRGRSVAGAKIDLYATRGTTTRATKSASDGTFAFASVPPEVVLSLRGPASAGGGAPVERTVTTKDGETSRITLVLPDPRPALPFRVEDARGSGISAAQVTALSLDPQVALRTTVFADARGEGAIEGARGLSLTLEATAPGHAKTTVTLDPSAVRARIALAEAADIEGEVRTARHGGAAGAEVTIVTDAGITRVRTRDDGTFRASAIPIGTVQIRVRALGHAPAAREATVEARRAGRPSSIPRIDLVEEAVVTGVVVDTKGAPVAGARVAKDRAPAALVGGPGTSDARDGAWTKTDEKGKFSLGGLSEGTVRLDVLAPGRGRGSAAGIEARAGRSVDAGTITLRPEGVDAERPAPGGVAVTLVASGPASAGGTSDEPVVLALVAEGSAAERAGLRPGDVLAEIGGTTVASIGDARARLGGPLATDVVVKIVREGKPIVVRVPREAIRR